MSTTACVTSMPSGSSAMPSLVWSEEDEREIQRILDEVAPDELEDIAFEGLLGAERWAEIKTHLRNDIEGIVRVYMSLRPIADLIRQYPEAGYFAECNTFQDVIEAMLAPDWEWIRPGNGADYEALAPEANPAGSKMNLIDDLRAEMQVRVGRMFKDYPVSN